MDVFSSLFGLLQDALDTYIHQSVTNAVNYVDGPIKIMATLSVMGFGSLYILGKTAGPPVGDAQDLRHHRHRLHCGRQRRLLQPVPGQPPARSAQRPDGRLRRRRCAVRASRASGKQWIALGHTAMDGISTIWYAGSGFVANRIRDVGDGAVHHLRSVRGRRLRRHGHRHGGLVPGGGHRPHHDPGPHSSSPRASSSPGGSATASSSRSWPPSSAPCSAS